MHRPIRKTLSLLAALLLSLPLGFSQQVLLDRVEETYRAGLEVDPNSTGLLMHLAELLETREEYKAAIHYRQQLLSLQPANVTYRFLLGVAYLKAGLYSEAIGTLEALTRDHPDHEAGYFSLGSAYARRGQFSQAADAYQKALALDPHDDQARLALASALTTLLRYQDARPLVLDYLSRHAEDPRALSLLGQADQVLGNSREAEDMLRHATRLSPGLYDAHYQLGLVLLQKGDVQAAVDCFERAAALQPTSPEPHYQLSRAYRSLQQMDLAQREGRLVEEQHQQSAQQTRALVLANQAAADFSAGRTQIAIDGYRAALALDPKNGKLLYDLALAYGKHGDTSLEKQALLQAEAFSPSLAVVHNQLGMLALQQQAVDSARKEFQQAIADDPEFAEALSNLGVLYGRAGDVAGAEWYLRRAIENEPGLIEAHVNLGLMLAAESKLAAAARAEQDALALSPHDPGAQAARKRIAADGKLGEEVTAKSRVPPP